MKLSIKWLILFLTIAPLVLLAVLQQWISDSAIDRSGRERVENWREKLMTRRRESLRHYSQIAKGAVERYYKESARAKLRSLLKARGKEFKATLERYVNAKKDELGNAGIRAGIIDFVRAYRFNGGRGYFWINDFHPTMICHPIKPSLDGKDLSDYTDRNGTRMFVAMARVCRKNGDGFVRYHWLNPVSKRVVPKTSYVFTFRRFNWIIGTGEYDSIFDAEPRDEARKTIASLAYGKRNSFWILDENAAFVSSPGDVDIDKDGLDDKARRKALEICRTRGEGFFQISRSGIKQLVFVRGFEKWKWVIGTNVDISDIDKLVEMERNRIEAYVSATKRSHVVLTVIEVFVLVLVVMLVLRYAFNRPLENIMKTLSDFDSDPSIRMGDDFISIEFSKVASRFNALLDRLSRIVSRVHSSSGQIDETSKSISRVLDEQAGLLKAQAASLTQVTASVTELSETAGAIDDQADNVGGLASVAYRSSKEGERSVEAVVAKLEEIHFDNQTSRKDIADLGERSKRIARVKDIIGEIAEHTKLIAFNAALEAAGAGEAGRRFGVVADEIRELADTIVQSTREIADEINQSRSAIDRIVSASETTSDGIEQGLHLAMETVQSLLVIVNSVESTRETVEQIRKSTKEQKSGTRRMVDVLRQIDERANKSSDMLDKVGSIVNELSVAASALHGLVAEFEGKKQLIVRERK